MIPIEKNKDHKNHVIDEYKIYSLVEGIGFEKVLGQKCRIKEIDRME